jgi:hypothetical protein
MSTYRVTCKEKHSLYERIAAIGCTNTVTGSKHRFLEDDAIKRIEDKSDSFFVEDSRGISADVRVEERGGRKFLITERDGVKDDNLLYLPDCEFQKTTGAGSIRSVSASGSHCVHRNIRGRS